MGSGGKKRTTRAKMDREGKLREKRVEKEARKAARRLFAADGDSESPPVFGSGELEEGSTELDELPVDDEPQQAAPVLDAARIGS
jgi:hypothetical protein